MCVCLQGGRLSSSFTGLVNNGRDILGLCFDFRNIIQAAAAVKCDGGVNKHGQRRKKWIPLANRKTSNKGDFNKLTRIHVNAYLTGSSLCEDLLVRYLRRRMSRVFKALFHVTAFTFHWWWLLLLMRAKKLFHNNCPGVVVNKHRDYGPPSQ